MNKDIDKFELQLSDLRTIDIICKISTYIPYKGKFSVQDKFINKTRKFKLDTGATHTCINALDLGIHVSEEEFKQWKKI